GTASRDGFELTPLRHASTDVEDHLAQGGAHGNLDEAGVINAAGEREALGAFAFLGADLRIPFAAIAKNGSDAGEGFDVLDESGLADHALLGRIGRTGTWNAASALDRGQKRGFFSADKGARAQTHIEVEAQAAPTDVVAEQAQTLGLLDSSAQALDGQRIFGAHIEVTFGSADGKGSDQHAFQHAVRIALEHAAVHECARIALVRVADNVFF